MLESIPSVKVMNNERTLRRALILIALVALAVGLAATFTGRNRLAHWIWAAGTIPVVAALATSIIREVVAVLAAKSRTPRANI
jgi:hypothetical protein